MSATLGTRIIDGDGHIMEDTVAIIARMESPYREIAARKGVVFPPLDHLHSGRAVETPPQRDQRPAVGPKGWLEFLDDVGIEWTVLYPTTALSYGKIVSLDYAVSVSKAYNDWLYETYVKFNSRFKGMAILPMQDPQEAAKELRRAVTELGMLGAMMPSNGLAHPLGSKMYWPIYEEANNLGCCLAVHGGAPPIFSITGFSIAFRAFASPFSKAVLLGSCSSSNACMRRMKPTTSIFHRASTASGRAKILAIMSRN